MLEISNFFDSKALSFIAEDLGYPTDEVKQMLSDYGDSFEVIRNTPVRGGEEDNKSPVEDFENVLNFAREIEEKMSGPSEGEMISLQGNRPMTAPKPDIQLRQVENGFLGLQVSRRPSHPSGSRR